MKTNQEQETQKNRNRFKKPNLRQIGVGDETKTGPLKSFICQREKKKQQTSF